MIVPRNRLLAWVVVLVLPCATSMAVFPDTALLSGGLILLLLVLGLLDAALAFGSLDGIAVELPKVVRLSKDRAGQIDLQITNDRAQRKELRLGLALPGEIHSPDEELLVLLPAKSQSARLTWPCMPIKRGNYLLTKCHVEGASPMGFWAVRGTLPVNGELRVYPNLMTERNSVAALFLNRGNYGAHAQRQVGKGRDFEKLREYIPGDGYDEIHWKATAKRGRPVTKVFQIERTQEVYVVIDASRLSARIENRKPEPAAAGGVAVVPPTLPGKPMPVQSETTTLERFITAALVLGLAAERQGDLFGVLTFSDKIQRFVRARNGKAHYGACRDALYTLHPQIVTPDFDELAAFIRQRLRRRALLIFLTALDDPLLAESFVRNMDLICHQHLILVNMMEPPGARPLFSDPNVSRVDDLYQQLAGHVLWHNLRELDKVLQRRGVRFKLLDNEKMSAQLVTQYLSIKQRQLI